MSVKLKKKTNNVIQFIDGLHEFITTHPQFRVKTNEKSEPQIQSEIRPIIISYLENHFRSQGYKDPVAKAHKSFYWEGQEGKYGPPRDPVFGARNYPDFIIDAPYKIAVEYKQNKNGSIIKQGIGQSIIHTLSGDFDYVYFLFHDQSTGGLIRESLNSPKGIEVDIVNRMWNEFNVYTKIVGQKHLRLGKAA